MAKGKEVALVLSDDQMAALRAEYPVEASFNRTLLPRLSMYSQDKFEGKGKNAILVKEAGMFYTEQETDEVDPNTGKQIWLKTELGTDIEGIILYQRKQLRFYDESTKEYTSSPVYDSDDEMVPLFKNRVKIATDLPKNLKVMYPGVSKKTGKPISNLSEDRILYFMLKDSPELYQMSVHGSSMYSFLDYARKNLVPTVLTGITSEPKESGSIAWNQMVFAALRKITPQEAITVLEKVREIKAGIEQEKAFFAGQKPTTEEDGKPTLTLENM